MPDEPATADDLYGLDPSGFVSARNELAKRLKAGGDKEEAQRVAALRRPTATAAAVNHLARGRPDLVAAVIDAGIELRRATQEMIKGDRSGFRSAQAAERKAVDEATAAAAQFLVAIGGRDTDSSRQRIAESLRAAAVDHDVADLVRRGVLEADASSPGFGMDGLQAAEVQAPAPSGPVRTEPDPHEEAERRKRLEVIERELGEAERRADAAAERALRAEERAKELRRAAEDAQRRLHEAVEKLGEARARARRSGG